MPLTEQQKRFADNYVLCLNATKAAIDAGYSSKNKGDLRVRASQLLKKPCVSNYIKEKLDKIQSDQIIKAEELQIFLTSCIRGNQSEKRIHILRKSYKEGNKAVCKDETVEIETQIAMSDRLKAANIMAKILCLMDSNPKNEEPPKVYFDLNLPEDNN
jgi:phage terminase small subunit